MHNKKFIENILRLAIAVLSAVAGWLGNSIF